MMISHRQADLLRHAPLTVGTKVRVTKDHLDRCNGGLAYRYEEATGIVESIYKKDPVNTIAIVNWTSPTEQWKAEWEVRALERI